MKRPSICEKCIHAKFCLHDKLLFGDMFVPGNPVLFDNEALYEKYIAQRDADISCKDYEPAMRWIPVTERLPEDDRQVLCCTQRKTKQKGIVIGKGGEMLKQIGSTARSSIEEMSGRKIFLELRVKVNKNWRDDPFVLGLLGYATDKKKKK